MTTCEIIQIDGEPALRLTREILAALDVEIGDEVKVIEEERQLIIRAVSESHRTARVKQLFAELLVQRESAYRRLAEGVK